MIVTVAVVSRNTREPLLRCLRSLESASASGRARVWIVDNASTDGSAAAARELAPWAHVIGAQRNLGFGGAVNLVARGSDDEWLLATTADVALEAGALDAMLAAGVGPAVGCVAPKLVLADGGSEHSVHPFPTVSLTIALNLGAERLIPGLGERMYLDGYWDPDQPRAVPWAIGACLLIRRAAFDAVGGFDEREWMYAEDLDLCWRLRERGWTIRYEPAARVERLAGAAASGALGGDRTATFTEATYPVITRRRGRVGAAAMAAINLGGAAGRLAWMIPVAPFRPRWRATRDVNRLRFAVHRQGMGVALRGDHAARPVAAAGSR
jgi:GT2 family glycosyltransferase